MNKETEVERIAMNIVFQLDDDSDLSVDYDNDGNNIVPCPICLDRFCPSKEDGKCPQEDAFAAYYKGKEDGYKTAIQEVVRIAEGEECKDFHPTCINGNHEMCDTCLTKEAINAKLSKIITTLNHSK